MFKRLNDFAYRRPWRWAAAWAVAMAVTIGALMQAFHESVTYTVLLLAMYGGVMFVVVGLVRSRQRGRR